MMARAPMVLSLAFGLLSLVPSASADHRFLRGDANGDGVLDISDGIATLQWLFICSDECPLGCGDAADFNDDGVVEMTDAIASFGFLFQGGAPPAEPHGAPGEDATADDMICDPEHGAEMWQQRIEEVGHQTGNSVVQTDDGGFAVAGITQVEGAAPAHSRWDGLLIKTDAFGQVQWRRTYGGDYRDGFHAIRRTADGGFILVGDTRVEGSVSRLIWLVKTDSEGQELWSQRLDGERDGVGYAVEEAGDGGYLVVGNILRVDTPGTRALVLKTNSEGTELWRRQFGSRQLHAPQARSVRRTVDGGYVVVGFGYAPGNSVDAWLLKIDSEGEEIWSRTFGGSRLDRGLDVKQTADGGYIVIGDETSFGEDSFTDAWLLKTDSEGNEQWNRSYGRSHAEEGAGRGHDNGTSVVQTGDGGFVFVGKLSINRNSEAWIVKTDADGAELWSRSFNALRTREAHAVQQTRDDGFIIAAHSTTGLSGVDVSLIKTDSEGNVE